MKKFIILILLLSLFISKNAFSQCGTIMVNASNLQYPDTSTNLPQTFQNVPYSATLQLYAPSTVMVGSIPVTITNYTINSISGLPSGFTYTQYPVSGVLPGGSAGCINFTCSNVIAPLATYPLTINATINSPFGSSATSIVGYKIVIKAIPTNIAIYNSIAPPTNAWYSVNDWIDSLATGSTIPDYGFLMKDSLSKYADPSGGSAFGISSISIGSAMDVSDAIINNYNPALRSNDGDSAVVDSLLFPYSYIRNTDSIMVGTNKLPVVDTLFVTWYKNIHLFRGYFTASGTYCTFPPGASWDSTKLRQTLFLKVDTILLRKPDTTTVFNNNGGWENEWTQRTMKLRAPSGLIAGTSSANKLFGYSIKFSSGVSARDTGWMIYQINPSGLPTGLKRPNYFSFAYQSEQGSGDASTLMDKSYSGSYESRKEWAYQHYYSWIGHIPNSAFNPGYRWFLSARYKIRNFGTSKCFVSDTVICKGNKVYFQLNNCTLFQGTNNLGSNTTLNQSPKTNTVYTLKSNTGIIISTFTIKVNDSLNLQRVTSSDTLNFCGVNGKFLLGVSSSYPGAKNYTWSNTDSTLASKNAIDSFTYASNYKVIVSSNTGCQSEYNFKVNKNNNIFNPDFSSNRQSATSTPFDFNFANQTPSLASYDFVWNWGDGFKDSTNNPFVFKTYFANGTYSVKLIAKNKTTGCKDSITKTNYITCSGLLPLNFTSFKTLPSCFGSANGSLTVVPSGGVTPYQYKIDAGAYQSGNTFSNLAAGVYTIYVKDAYNTVYSRLDTLSNPAAISAGAITGATTSYINTANTYSVASQSGAAYAWSAVNGTVSAGAGSNSIQVTWGSTAGAGKVILVFSKNGCSVSDTLNVTLNTTPLSMSSSKTLPVCVGSSNASITVTAAGGVSPYLYRINNGAYQSSNTFSNLSAGIYSLDVKDAINGVVSKTDTILNPAPLTTGGITGANSVGVGTLKPYQIAAQSGAIYSWNIINGTLMAGNGTNSIQVQWAALAGAGKVIITLTKNTCTTADTMEITITASPMNLSATKTNPTCNASNNGSISLSVSGGSAPYQYSINNGAYQSSNTFSNLIAGTYLLKAKDALNSIVSISDSLIDPAPVVIGGISGPVVVGTGNSGAYTVNNHNGTSYVWSAMNGTILSGNGTPNAMVQWGASAGTGKVILKLGINGCYDSDTLEVTISGSLPFSMSTNKENLTCFGGGKITVNAVGGTMPYQYALNTGAFQTSNVFTGLSAGIYLVKAKDNSGTSLQQYDTIQNLGQAVVAGAINGPAAVPTLALSTYIAGQQTGITYSWNVTGGLLASGQGTNIIQVSWGATATTGKVNLRVSNTGGCSDSSTLSVTVGTNGLNQLQGNSFSVYPNPASETVSISNNNSLKGAQVQLVDMLGRIVLEENITSNNNQYSLNIANVKPGSYLVIIKNKETYSRNKLVIE